jgi:hypothetical protein
MRRLQRLWRLHDTEGRKDGRRHTALLVRGRAARGTSPRKMKLQSSHPPKVSVPPAPGSSDSAREQDKAPLPPASAPLAAWLRKVFAEAAHKLAVKGAIAIMIALLVAAALGFFAVLNFDHTPLLGRLHDFIEKQIYAGRRSGVSGPAIETGSFPRSEAPPAPLAQPTPLPPSMPQPWTVDIFPERD